MDTSAIDIIFDSNGFCNFCKELISRSKKIIFDENEKKSKYDILLKNLFKRKKKS